MNLRKIRQAIPTPTTQHPFCFRLEPQQSSENAIRPWIIECKSQSDMETWIAAIQSRIAKYSTSIKSPCHTSSPAASLLLSPKINSAAAPETSKSTPRIVSTCSIMNNVSPEVYRMPALPLRCTNLTSFDDDEEEGKESLLSRRNKKLAPIITINRQQQEEIVIEEEEVAPQSSYSTSTLCSSTLPSPTGAVLGPLISPGIIDRYSQYNNKALMQSSSQPSLIISTKEALLYQQKQQQAEKEEGEQSSSPTYLMYKKRFRL